MSHSAAQRVGAEAIGTALLVAAVVGSGIMAQALAGGNEAIALLANTLATGAMLYVLILTLGPVSGAHLNPAVSAVFALRGELAWGTALAFFVAQVAGGIGGTLLAHAMFDQPLLQVATHARGGAGQWLSEAVASFALVFTILGTARARPEAAPGSVALVIVAGYWFTASTAFANPAVTLARAWSDSFAGIAPVDVPMFVVAQVLGAGLAALAAGAFGWHPPPAPPPPLAGRLGEERQ